MSRIHSAVLGKEPPAPPSGGYQQYTAEILTEEPKSGGCLPGCFIWVVSLVGIGALVSGASCSASTWSLLATNRVPWNLP